MLNFSRSSRVSRSTTKSIIQKQNEQHYDVKNKSQKKQNVFNQEKRHYILAQRQMYKDIIGITNNSIDHLVGFFFINIVKKT